MRYPRPIRKTVMTPSISVKSATARATRATFSLFFALCATVVLGVVVFIGGVASAHGNAGPRTSTSSTSHRAAARERRTKRLPVLEAGVLYRAAGTEYGGFGDGEVRPKGISTSGVGATNGVTKIAWKSWGGKSATGMGSGCVIKSTGIEADCRVTRATVVVYDLGTCAGKPAYLAVTWYFPSLGQKLAEKGTIPNPSCNAKASKRAPATATPSNTSTTGSPPTTAASTTTTTIAPTTSAAPCTMAAITAAAETSSTDFYSVNDFGCSGDFAYAFVTVGTTPNLITVTDLFMAVNGEWQPASRGMYCTNGSVPAAIYEPACQTQ